MKEKRLGYVDILAEEFKILTKVVLKDNTGLELYSFKTKKSVKEAAKECENMMNKTPKIYEVIIREVK